MVSLLAASNGTPGAGVVGLKDAPGAAVESSPRSCDATGWKPKGSQDGAAPLRCVLVEDWSGGDTRGIYNRRQQKGLCDINVF